jgi:DNA-directed RNA polymerase specialized sigma24 family protein
MDRRDAAQALGVSLTALDVRLHRARAQLRKEIERRRQEAAA